MNRTLLVSSLVVAALTGCKGKQAAPVAEKTVEAAPPVAAPAPTTLGGFDLAATTLDVAALYPGATATLVAGDPGRGNGSEDDEVIEASDTVAFVKGTETLAEIELADGKASTLRVYEHPTIEEVARQRPEARCLQDKWGVRCSAAGLTYLFDDNAGIDGDWGTEVAIAKVKGGGARATWIEWSPPPDRQPVVAGIPAVAEPDDDEGPVDQRKPTAAEIDRCARLSIVASGCGFDHDFEFGWHVGTPATLSLALARRACDVDFIATEDGPAMPVPIFDEAQVAALEQAARQGCPAVRAILDQDGLGVSDSVP